MNKLLKEVYGEAHKELSKDINNLIMKYSQDCTKEPLSSKDSILITYGDSINGTEYPLKELKKFMVKNVKDNISSIHLLPMFPFTSDDGFSVVDYLKINPELGDWDNIEELGNDYKLMFDAVVNHISKSSDWFKGYLNDEEEYSNFFIECSDDIDYSDVVRPRALPLYYNYETKNGNKKIWATFSEDQVDINFGNPKVLVKVMEVLLEYAKRGAKYIRLDAIGFIWKEIGTTCIHHENTHKLIKIMRSVMEECYPNTKIITETNVPHLENISYFGDNDEAHMVYQFPLPPLVLFSFINNDAVKLAKWVKSLNDTPLTKDTTYFNFLASHDGIGVRPVEGILNDAEIKTLVDNTTNKGGRISFKTNSDGSKSPYELNINYLDAVCDTDSSNDEKAKKFIAAQSILLSLQGVPGIYVHSLLGSENDVEGMISSGVNRRINREKLRVNDLEAALNDSNSLRSKVFSKYNELLEIRSTQKVFNPYGSQDVLFLNDKVLSVTRSYEEDELFYLVNVSDEKVKVSLPFNGLDLITNNILQDSYTLKPYEYVWLKKGE